MSADRVIGVPGKAFGADGAMMMVCISEEALTKPLDVDVKLGETLGCRKTIDATGLSGCGGKRLCTWLT
jgi:hypothetical protein